jgi:thiol-disulfide isomerase/thioredoxin
MLGTPCPAFELPGTDGHLHTLDEFGEAKLLVVIVSCNHCPYVVAYEERMVALERDYRNKGVRLLAINANDTVRYPADSMDKMVLRGRQRGFEFPYVRDDAQETVRALGARFTPEVFVFDQARLLRYHGRIDDNYGDASRVKRQDLRLALDALLDGRLPEVAETSPIGCSVKWK